MIKRKKPKVSSFKDINRKSIKEGDFLKALNYYGLEVNALDPQLLEEFLNMPIDEQKAIMEQMTGGM